MLVSHVAVICTAMTCHQQIIYTLPICHHSYLVNDPIITVILFLFQVSSSVFFLCYLRQPGDAKISCFVEVSYFFMHFSKRNVDWSRNYEAATCCL